MSYPSLVLFRQCAPIFATLQDESRQQILVILYENGELSVNAIAAKMSISRSAVSHHLKQLLLARMVVMRKEGKERYYHFSLDHLLQLMRPFLASLEELQKKLKQDF